MNQKEYWNSVSETKTFTLPFDGERFSKYAEKDSAIVDVGCYETDRPDFGTLLILR